jgi:hypothetical protein
MFLPCFLVDKNAHCFSQHYAVYFTLVRIGDQIRGFSNALLSRQLVTHLVVDEGSSELTDR